MTKNINTYYNENEFKIINIYMDRKEFIVTGKLKELYQSVFEKKINEKSDGSYTAPLSEDEEALLVQQLLSGRSSYLGFLQKYQKHYPLSNKAMDLLIENLDKDFVLKFLEKEFTLYSFTESQGLAICNAAKGLDNRFLHAFCTSGRIFYSSVYQKLSLLGINDKNDSLPSEENWGELYKKSVNNYRNNL